MQLQLQFAAPTYVEGEIVGGGRARAEPAD
jgi:hypothetical protein